MAFFGPLAAVRARCAHLTEFAAALDYAARTLTPGSVESDRILALADGGMHREELAGGAYALEMAYQPKLRVEGFFETHRRFVDVQVMVAGEELMELAPAAALTVTAAYDEARDLTRHGDTGLASVLRARAGDIAIFWPEDAHMPSLAADRAGPVRKTVVKVPVG